MNERQNLLHHIANWRQNHQAQPPRAAHWNRWLPAPGNILFTLLMIGLLIFTQRAWATPVQNINAPGPSAVNYQGNLTAPNGAPKNGSFDMSFAIYNAASGGTRVWGPENHNAVPVSNGIFNIGLGSKTSGGIPTTIWNGDRYLEITVGGETLSPRELIRSVPLAGMAMAVPGNSIGTSHLTQNAVTNTQTVVVGPNEGVATTTSTTFENIPGYEIIMETTGAPVLLTFQATARGNQDQPGNSVLLDYAINGVRIGQSDWGISRIISYSLTENTSMIWIAQPPAGIHTFTVQWRVVDNSIEALINRDAFTTQFAVTELKR